MKNIIITLLLSLSFNCVAASVSDDCLETDSTSIINPNLDLLMKGTQSTLNSMKTIIPNNFVLVVNNQCNQLMTLAIVLEESPSLGVSEGKTYVSETYTKGWWLVKPGTTQELKIDHALSRKYYVHARTSSVFWGKDKEFPVTLGGEPQKLKFSAYEAIKKCEFVANKGVYYCTHTFKCE